MLGILIESQRQARRQTGGSVVSVLMHGAIVASVAAATATTHREPPPRRDPPPIFVHPVAPPSPVAPRSHGNAPSTPSAVPRLPALRITTIAATEVSAIDVPVAATTVDFGDVRAHQPFCGVVCPTAGRASAVEGETTTWSAAEAQMQFREPPVPPRYPEALRSAGVEGSVTVKFIVDTTGRIDPASIEVMSSTHAQFTASVRDALRRLRFYPATVGGKTVRAAAIMPFQFTLK